MKRIAKNWFGAGLLAFALLSLRISAAPPAGYYLVWNDEFNGTALDTTKWDYWLLGTRRDAVNVTNAVSVSGGYLRITTYTSAGVHYTGFIATDGTFRSRYGYWESSIQWGDTNGMWSAFWMQSPTMGTYLNDPFVSGSEMDIVEHRYVDGATNNIANVVQNNIHWNGYGSAAKSAGRGNIGSGLATGFHTYGFLWTPSVYALYVDGANLRSWNYVNNGVPISESTEWAILSSEVDDTSTTWAGYIPAGGYGSLASSTTKLTADYVRYYAPTNMIFWTGTNSAYLTNPANWIASMPPLSSSDLQFSMLSGNNLTPQLGGDLAVDGLAFLNMNNGISLNGANTLGIGAGGIDMLAANHSVNLNCPINIVSNQTWMIGPNNPGNTLTVNGPVSGSATLTKASYGTLIFNGTNTFSGTLNVDSGSTTSSDGIVRLTRAANVANAAAIAIRNNNGGSSTLQIDGTLGSFSIPQNVSLNGRNTNVVAIENRVGSNTIAGGLTINVGGGFYPLQSDAGTLAFGGIISSLATGSRTLTFQGGGDFYISANIQNGGASSLGIVKTNTGTLTLTGANSCTGPTAVSGGKLVVNGGLASSSVAVTSGTLGGSGTISGSVSIQPGATISPGGTLSALTIANSLSLAGNAFFELNQAAHTNDSIRGLTSVTYSGTLLVTNLSGSLTPNDTFKLFDAALYSGAFTAISPSSPGKGLLWNTNTLTTDGTLRLAYQPMGNVSTQLAGTNILLSTTNGVPNGTWSILGSTDLSLPLAQWPVVSTGYFSSAGAFAFTNGLSPAVSQQFLRLRQP